MARKTTAQIKAELDAVTQRYKASVDEDKKRIGDHVMRSVKAVDGKSKIENLDDFKKREEDLKDHFAKQVEEIARLKKKISELEAPEKKPTPAQGSKPVPAQGLTRTSDGGTTVPKNLFPK